MLYNKRNEEEVIAQNEQIAWENKSRAADDQIEPVELDGFSEAEEMAFAFHGL